MLWNEFQHSRMAHEWVALVLRGEKSGGGGEIVKVAEPRCQKPTTITLRWYVGVSWQAPLCVNIVSSHEVALPFIYHLRNTH